MPKHAVNTSEQTKIRKLFQAGNSAQAIAAHMNVDLSVVEAWHPDNVQQVKERNRELEIAAGEQQAEKDTAQAEADAAAAKRSEAGKKAAATRMANQKAKKDAARDADRKLAEEREAAQQAAASMSAEE